MQPLREAIGDLSKRTSDTESNLYWAWGCDKCKRGIVSAPELTGAVALYAERLVHAVDGDVTFCTCRAGHMARQHLRKLYATRQAETKGGKTGDMVGAFDEVVWARQKIAAAYETMATTPTVHAAETEQGVTA